MAPLLCSPAVAEASGPSGLKSAVKLVESALQSDSAYPLLVDQFAAYGPLPSCSGLQDLDYPADPYCAAAPAPGASMVCRRVPLPAELAEQAAHAQMQCRLGLFPEIGRAWLVVDSDLFVWRYETGDDLAYFDGLSEAILAVGLVQPRPGVFQRHIHSLLCLATCTEIVILGATMQGDELLLQPEPVFTLSADGVPATCVVGSALGRIFLGGRDGCLYEIVYSAGSSWFGSRCRKVNHSSSTLSYLLPAFLSLPFGKEDPIVQTQQHKTASTRLWRNIRRHHPPMAPVHLEAPETSSYVLDGEAFAKNSRLVRALGYQRLAKQLAAFRTGSSSHHLVKFCSTSSSKDRSHLMFCLQIS
ncbi:nuclear pore complex protein Nup155 [Rhipicephalus sanguineus]|uniref:nuclear pore complex protein Nup155 n=1 Tax=Rhipicephalus sanguineus TaxID=34632 RepID=UPI0020C33415|nr:nuclear pore complex protein Nup155 [Rhipicephalus sanguineus]